jgi:hypothetical protein
MSSYKMDPSPRPYFIPCSLDHRRAFDTYPSSPIPIQDRFVSLPRFWRGLGTWELS